MSADVADLAAAVHRDGFAGLPGAFPPEWAQQPRQDFDALYAEARATDGGTVSRKSETGTTARSTAS